MAKYDQKGDVATNFDTLDLRNGMVPFMTLLVSHDPKSDVVPHFSHLDLRNVMMPLKTLSIM